MREIDTASYTDPLDILRRFVPTPLKAVYRICSIPVVVETNDFSLLPELPLNACHENYGGQIFQWKLVRDSDSRGPLMEPMILSSGSLTIVSMGPSCLIGVDHDRRELLGFVGADVDARTHQDYLIPFFCRLTKDAVYGRPAFSASNNECAND